MKLKTLFALAIIFLVLGLGIQAAGQAAKVGCSLEKTAGDWAAQSGGKFNGADAMLIGTYHLNKDGTSSTHVFLNVDGTVFLELNRVGTATMGEDCILTQTWEDGGPLAKCVVLDDANEIWCAYDQPGFSNVTLKRIHRRD